MFNLKISENLQTFLSGFSLNSQNFDLISYFLWVKVYRQNNEKIDYKTWSIHGLK